MQEQLAAALAQLEQGRSASARCTRCRELTERLALPGESAKGRMVSSDALTDANKEIGSVNCGRASCLTPPRALTREGDGCRRLQAELEQVRAEMKRMVPSGDAERLEEQLGRAKADAARHRALLQGMVPAQH
eukprot:1950536-Rhodomonas_salina.1